MFSVVPMDKREFLKFFAGAGTVTFFGGLAACATSPVPRTRGEGVLFQSGLGAIKSDELKLMAGLSYQVLIKAGDSINSREIFGANADFNALLPINGALDEYILWTNHEAFARTLLHKRNFAKSEKPTQKEVDIERKSVGGSLTHWKKNSDESWKFLSDSKLNRRISAETMIPFDNKMGIKGSKVAVGTLANCAGGITSWKTILSCEENYHNYYGSEAQGGWSHVYNLPSEHYGWVVEIEPLTGKAIKRISLGRFSHESATCVKASTGQEVVYMGDDAPDQFIYKFISHKPKDLSSGTLYVANTEEGKWIPIDLEKSPKLKNSFSDSTEVMINVRAAASILGGTPQDRPEDIKVQPGTGHVYVTLTGNPAKNRFFGSIVKIEEADSNPLSLSFKFSTLVAGGVETGFACPDNLAFDGDGDLWMTSDISGSKMNQGNFASFGNNGLFLIPLSGKHKGQPIKVASAPMDAEITGLQFTPNFSSLICSVQHPGETSLDVNQLTSHWPEGGSEFPKSSVISMNGIRELKKSI